MALGVGERGDVKKAPPWMIFIMQSQLVIRTMGKDKLCKHAILNYLSQEVTVD